MTDTTPPPSSLERVTRWVQDHALAVAATALVGIVATAALAVAVVGGGAGDGQETPATTAAGTPTGGTAATPASAADPTGTGTTLPPGTGSNLIAVKIDNAEPARPQIGLDAARVVIEAPAEGGITRYLAFFPPGDNLVGPVRSARPVDVDLVGLLSDTLVSTGGRPFVLGALTGSGISLVGADPLDSPFQTLERPSPHNLFLSLSEAPAAGQVEGGLPGGDFPTDGAPADTFQVPYATPVTWTRDGDVYVRADGGAESVILPAFDGEPLPYAVDTVVVMAVNERSAGYQDSNQVDVPTYDVIGSGQMWVYHGGIQMQGSWFRASQADGYLFRTDDGEPFGLPEGRTFIHLVPRSALTG